jgi:hypothetical protein
MIGDDRAFPNLTLTPLVASYGACAQMGLREPFRTAAAALRMLPALGFELYPVWLDVGESEWVAIDRWDDTPGILCAAITPTEGP